MHTVLARFLKDCDADQLVREVFLSLIHAAGGRTRDSNRLGLLSRRRPEGIQTWGVLFPGPGGGRGEEGGDSNRENYSRKHTLDSHLK